MVTRIVRLTFQPDMVGEFIAIFNRSSGLIRASEGCMGVRLMRDTEQPHVFFTLSEWESEAHLERYRHSELFRTTWAGTKLLFAQPPVAHSTTDSGL
ncbi:MAG: antibiotic biosynthesis monooxygenase [Flavobacteriales bacterium]|nr:antibiotic biosynthesis monooxygenase [Flavobacteriales bacterium]